MLRKTLTVLAVMAAVGAGTAGVANASTPAPSALCVPGAPVAGCTPHGGHHDGFGFGLGRGLGFNDGGLLGTGLLRGGDFNRGGRWGHYQGSFWNRGGVILPYSQVVSSCGCADPASLGYTLVENPATVMVVPVGAVATGDGSCALSSVNFGLDRYRHGVRFFRR